MRIGDAFEVLRRYRFELIIAGVRTPVARVVSDPFEDHLWICTSHTIGISGEAPPRQPDLTERLQQAGGRMQVVLMRRSGALGRLYGVTFDNVVPKTFDLDADNDGPALEWVRLDNVKIARADY